MDKLDKITKLLAVPALREREKEQDKIELLDQLGFRPVEIAKILNKSPENVGVVLGNIRKKKAPKTGALPTPVPLPVTSEGST
jgi:hypothetical protein